MPWSNEITITVVSPIPEQIKVTGVTIVDYPSKATAGEPFTIRVQITLEHTPPSGYMYVSNLAVYVNDVMQKTDVVYYTAQTVTKDIQLTLYEPGTYRIRIYVDDYATRSA